MKYRDVLASYLSKIKLLYLENYYLWYFIRMFLLISLFCGKAGKSFSFAWLPEYGDEITTSNYESYPKYEYNNNLYIATNDILEEEKLKFVLRCKKSKASIFKQKGYKDYSINAILTSEHTIEEIEFLNNDVSLYSHKARNISSDIEFGFQKKIYELKNSIFSYGGSINPLSVETLPNKSSIDFKRAYIKTYLAYGKNFDIKNKNLFLDLAISPKYQYNINNLAFDLYLTTGINLSKIFSFYISSIYKVGNIYKNDMKKYEIILIKNKDSILNYKAIQKSFLKNKRISEFQLIPTLRTNLSEDISLDFSSIISIKNRFHFSGFKMSIISKNLYEKYFVM